MKMPKKVDTFTYVDLDSGV